MISPTNWPFLYVLAIQDSTGNLRWSSIRTRMPYINPQHLPEHDGTPKMAG
ncbi:hypothetical protein GA0061078_1097 [Bifidobacterium bohemicum]|uniref:Uncharacterized protein n=1 Tax=Bifidobacterium bohemicum DSM 22767 TaxID=1437606 RepID=A0A086ZGK8_9BIFI|nr:hypothetical protein BBOH_0928 [Bifidobacterium bohemicum DSM 22767]SCB99364.1 hypothetical protein GA0061078_1097 [Bifidobacterium bohemicum]